MKIDVSDLLKELGSVLKINESATFDFSEDNVKLSSPVEVKLKLTNTGDSVLVSGTLKTNVVLSCSRCLKEYIQPVDIRIEEEYVKSRPAPRIKENEEIELKEKDFVFEISEKNIIDLDEAIRQNIEVALPIKSICSKTCKVALPDTGKKKIPDPRLAKLKEFNKTGGK